MKLFSIRKLLVLGAAATTLVVASGTASAGGRVHIDIPGFSIGYYDDHHYRKKYRKHRRHYKRHHKRHHRYYDDYYYYEPRRYYYYDGYRSRDRYRSRDSYRNDYDYCPTPGFSLRYYRNRGCYSHGDHYHCDD